MIDFRYHVVSIVAVFLALATGIALGAGPLKGGIDQRLVNAAAQDRQDKLDLRSELDRQQSLTDFQDDFVALTSSQLLSDRLDGRTVALFELPGADTDISSGIRDDIEAAGGTVTGTVSISSDLLSPQNRQVAEGLAKQVLDGVNGVPPTETASSYQLVGYSIARAYLTSSPQPAQIDGAARTIASSLEEAHFVSSSTELNRRADLAVVVVPNPPTQGVPGQDELVATLVGGMDAASGGVVVAGTPAAAGTGGFLTAVRGGSVAAEVSSVDEGGTAAGQVVAVLALAEQATGAAGQYGSTGSAEATMPSGAPTS